MLNLQFPEFVTFYEGVNAETTLRRSVTNGSGSKPALSAFPSMSLLRSASKVLALRPTMA